MARDNLINSALKADALRLTRYVRALLAVYTLLTVSSLAWNIAEVRSNALESAKTLGRMAIRKDMIYREWNSDHGRVYAPVTDQFEPSPHLKVPWRDEITQSGTRLTLVNPSLMTRLAHRIQNRRTGLKAHMTSLRPLRPQNAPDSWETSGLHGFERGIEEVVGEEDSASGPLLRIMRPLMTEESCLECHSHQGYSVGDIRGGISVTIPLAPVREAAGKGILALCFGHACLWALGVAGIKVGARSLNRRLGELRASEEIRERLIEDLKTTQENLRFQATHDSLTGLWNRTAILDALQREVARSMRKSEALSVIMADVDHFKRINDAHGHQAGDKALRETAARILSQIRPYDSAGRYGGEEFVIVLPGAGSQEARRIAERIRASFHGAPVTASRRVLRLTLSLGVACAERWEPFVDADSLVKAADEALYRAKNAGRDRVEVSIP